MIIGLLLPQRFSMPVEGATTKSYDQHSYWAYPWGVSVTQHDVIGTVGTSGNAKGKPPHLHYTIKTIIPYFWRADHSIQGWRKAYYLNPVDHLNAATRKCPYFA